MFTSECSIVDTHPTKPFLLPERIRNTTAKNSLKKKQYFPPENRSPKKGVTDDAKRSEPRVPSFQNKPKSDRGFARTEDHRRSADLKETVFGPTIFRSVQILRDTLGQTWPVDWPVSPSLARLGHSGHKNTVSIYVASIILPSVLYKPFGVSTSWGVGGPGQNGEIDRRTNIIRCQIDVKWFVCNVSHCIISYRRTWSSRPFYTP